MKGDNFPMDRNVLTISMQDDSPGYEISPARVPFATLATFAVSQKESLSFPRKARQPEAEGGEDVNAVRAASVSAVFREDAA